MNQWKEVSPGIFRTDYSGFLITKIETGKALTGKIDCHGQREYEPVYHYVAIKPGPPDVTRFAGGDIARIYRQIADSLQTCLF